MNPAPGSLMNTDGGALETLCQGLGVGDLGCDLGT